MSPALFGLGPLERWLGDPEVTEVLVNAGREVWIERGSAGPGTQYVGRLTPGSIDTIIERILAPIGRRLDLTSPIVDARLADGSRVCAVLPPVAVDGPCLSIRRFTHQSLALRHYGEPPVVELLAQLVDRRCNVVVSGATSSGKTTMLNALAGAVDPHERIVTLEDTAELRLGAPHVLRLETRPATADGVGAVSMAALLRAALRLRPDRLVVGEIRGDEAVELVQALNTGHDGSLATVHANGALDALARIESLVVGAAHGWPLATVRQHVERSIDVVIHLARRGIHEVVEVLPSDGDALCVRPLVSDGAVTHTLTRGRR